MTKLEYMTKLQEKLEKFGKELQEEILEDYRQHFVEGESEGRSEEEIIEELGNIEEMIRELSEEDLPEGFTQLDAGKEPDREKDVEAGQDVRNTDLKKSFSYSAYYKGIVLDGKVANVIVNRSEDDKIHVDYEAKGISNQLNYEFFQHEEDGIFYAGVKRRKGGRDEGDGGEKLVKVTLFGRTIISYGNIGGFGGDGQNITLTVRIPKGVPRLTVKVGSGNINVPRLELEAFEGISGSGNVVLDEMVADRMKAHCGSGNIKVSHTEFISGSFEAGSGNVKAEMIKGRDLKCGTGSGNIKVDSAAADYHLSTGSGSIRARAVGATERAELSAGSGSIRLELEGAKGMEAAVQSGSGSIHIEWEGQESQKVRNGTYAYGNSACKIRANTGSGSIKISGN